MVNFIINLLAKRKEQIQHSNGDKNADFSYGNKVEKERFEMYLKMCGSKCKKEWQTIGNDIEVPVHEKQNEGIIIPINKRFPNGELFPNERIPSRSTALYYPPS